MSVDERSMIVNHDMELEDGITRNDKRGLSVITTALFIVGEIVGTGILVMPSAIDGLGWMGPILVACVGLASIHTGCILSEAFLLVQQRYPEYCGKIRYPYPVVGLVTYGKAGRFLVSSCINVTFFGATVVFLIATVENVTNMLSAHVSVDFCYWLIIVACVLVPLTWFGTPSDFWMIGIGAMLASLASCCIMIAIMIQDSPAPSSPPRHNPTLDSFARAMGTLAFVFCGHPGFLTFQTDMKNPKKLSYSVWISYSIAILLYISVGVSGYLVYGSRIEDNVLLVMTEGPMLTAVQALMATHLLLAYVIVINPVCQHVEECFNIPKEFSWKRAVNRTIMVGISLLLAELTPKFGGLISLIGGSTIIILDYIMPLMCYSKLCSMEGDWPRIQTPLHIKAVHYEIMVVAILVGIAATYSAISFLATSENFNVSCFVNASARAS